MLDKIRKLLSGADKQAGEDGATLHLAAAVLLIAVARSDDNIDDEEILHLRELLRHDWRLDDAELDGLMAVARDAAEEEGSLDTHIDLINRRFSPARKLDLVRGLWQAANSDGRIHPREEVMIRRLAKLLQVSDAESLRSRQWAEEPGRVD